MRRKIRVGTTALTLPVYAINVSTGAGYAGLEPATAGLVFEFRRAGQSTWTAVTLAPATLGTWTSGGIVADGGLAGAYELGIPDAALAAGSRACWLRLRGAANLSPVLLEIELDAVDYQDAQGFGLARLDASIGSRSTYAGADTPGTATLLARIPGRVEPQTGDAFARLGSPAGASVSEDLAAMRSGVESQGETLAEVRAATHVSGVVVSDQAKAGYKLAADGLDSIPVDAPSGPATTFRGMIVQTWRRFFRKAVYDLAAGELRTFADDGATVVTAQSLHEDATQQAVGDAR